MPTIIASFGYDRLGANAMSSVAQWISLLLVLLAGYVAYVICVERLTRRFADQSRDKTQRRGLVVLGCVVVYFTFMVSIVSFSRESQKSYTYI